MSETGFVRHFIACNRRDPGKFAPFFVAGKIYGYVTRELAEILPRETGLFVPAESGIALDPRYGDFAGRSAALAEATAWLCLERGKKPRAEMYAVIDKWGDDPVAQIDRVAVPWFGARAWGVHMNGFVRKADGIHLWVGERAADRPADPGKLDNLVGGGQPIGLSADANMRKEAHEEAGIADALAREARLASTLSYSVERGEGLRRDTLFVYDLDLPPDFTPVNTDGEVAAFRLMPLDEAAALVRDTDRFKFNCNLVIIDFLMRHGYFLPGDAEYEELETWLTSRAA